MKCKIVKTPPETVCSSSMIEGQVGIIVNQGGLYDGAILLKAYSQYINLKDPMQVWNNEPRFQVRLLPPGTKIELTIE